MSNSDNYTSPVDMRDAIVQSPIEAWEYFDFPSTWVLKTNRDFSIELLNRYSREERETEQPEWASVFPNDTTYTNTARVLYRGAPFDEKNVLQLDEFRAIVVQPTRDRDTDEDEPDLHLTQYEAQLSHIMSGGHLSGGYFDSLNLQVK
ncbi:hypothetical protein [Natronococcus jeotgali]|uniref:hypothetical protein n=1 Tax=Natronococcus jeotgali TaxID=413812 RepID=UPI001268D540|nr:hypothetical protein [Natronococcus jeotgali]